MALINFWRPPGDPQIRLCGTWQQSLGWFLPPALGPTIPAPERGGLVAALSMTIDKVLECAIRLIHDPLLGTTIEVGYEPLPDGVRWPGRAPIVCVERQPVADERYRRFRRELPDLVVLAHTPTRGALDRRTRAQSLRDLARTRKPAAGGRGGSADASALRDRH